MNELTNQHDALSGPRPDMGSVPGSVDELDASSGSVDELVVSTLRFLAVDAVQLANSGHPGLPLGAAPMAFALWSGFLRFNPSHPEWADRDRFILSAGHGSALLYALLHVFRYGLPLEELKRFRQWESHTPGHPERGATPGVETTTGPLGQGFANAVGMAVAEAHLAAVYNRPGHDVVNHRTYVLCSDGDLMEGVASEAASLAGHLALGKLIALYDDNRITLSASTLLSFTEDVGQRFQAYGWHTVHVEDGNDLGAIRRALAEAVAETGKPSLLLIRTHIGFGSPHKQDSYEAHGSPLGSEEAALTKERLGWPAGPGFLVPGAVREYGERTSQRGAETEADWNRRFDRYADAFPELAASLTGRLDGILPDGWDAGLPVFQASPKGMATRVASGRILDAVAMRVPSLFGGSADLNPSTNTEIKGGGNFESPSRSAGDRQGAAAGAWDYTGRNLYFGIREHAMGAILNGLAAHGGFRAFGATFMVFSDYLRPAIRLASIMRLPITYVFTHDSIALGEDGTTHQPVEQLASLRAIPRLHVLRPADANETVEAWRFALEAKDSPTALILSRQALPVFDRTQYAAVDGLRRGAYVMADLPANPIAGNSPDGGSAPAVLLVASGSEVALIEEAGLALAAQGIAVRLVSMPSWELFEEQTPEYRNSVFPHDMPFRLAVEAGSPAGWHKYTGDHGAVLGVADYGSSAPGPVVMSAYGFSASTVAGMAKYLTDRRDA
jgi:transketolase